jgi:hypothetical protein
MKKQRRLPGRLLILPHCCAVYPGSGCGGVPPETVQRILVLHQFLLGDALMATSLLAKLRERYPAAEIILACPQGQVGLYQAGLMVLPSAGIHGTLPRSASYLPCHASIWPFSVARTACPSWHGPSARAGLLVLLMNNLPIKTGW